MPSSQATEILHAHPGDFDQIEDIKNRTQALHIRLKEHHDKHWLMWVQKEQDQIFTKKFGAVKPEHKRLEYTHKGKSMTWNEARMWCFNEARARINTKINMRHDHLDQASQNMRDAIMNQARNRYQTQGLAQQRLDSEVKEIHQSIHRQRMDAYHDFENNKVQRVEEARRNLSQTPERDVYAAYKQQDRNILANKENLLTQAYERHGFNYAMEKPVLTQKFTQKL